VEKVAWVLVRDGRLLVARNHGRDLFYLPGGRRELGESDSETLVREVREELGVTIDPSTMQLVAQVTAPRDGSPGEVTMTCYLADHRDDPAPASEIAELAWITAADRGRVTVAEQQVMDCLAASGAMPPR
jgi:8-oxo-dGTP pyrophosphatase MutT (NUDIX family)